MKNIYTVTGRATVSPLTETLTNERKRKNNMTTQIKNYQPKTGAPCYCKRGLERENCPACEGTGRKIDFAAIRARNTPPGRIQDSTHCFAVPGKDCAIDAVNSVTGKSWVTRETLEEVKLRHPDAVLMEWKQFIAEKAERQQAVVEWNEVAEEKYWEMLECLPPEIMFDEAFLVGEPNDHCATTGNPRFSAFKFKDEKYFESARPITLEEFKAIFTK